MGFYYGNEFYGLSIYNKKTGECLYKQSFTDSKKIGYYRDEVKSKIRQLEPKNFYDFMVLTTCTTTLDGLNTHISIQPIPGTPLEFKELIGEDFKIDIIKEEQIPYIF